VIKKLGLPANGFYTEEERVAGKRLGFLMKTLGDRTGYLAHQDIISDFHIRRYGVSIENIETIAVPSITPAKNNVIILDEIGKMECFSEVFKQAATNALDSSNIVAGTITLGGNDFIQEIKSQCTRTDEAVLKTHTICFFYPNSSYFVVYAVKNTD
jgi:nucleoside-triphosphatase